MENKKLINIFKKITLKDIVQKESMLQADLGMDSLAFTRLVIAIEEEFKVRFDDDYLELEAFTDVNSVYEYIMLLKE